jgi:chemotaxis protein CheC
VTDDLLITEEETDILQEIMNIAFGKAAADLAEIINIFVQLSVPQIALVKALELPAYLKTEVNSGERISIIEQNFWGEFKGSAFLVFQSGAGKELIALLGSDVDPSFESEAVEVLERETLMEVGNILIGACVGKVAELLQDVVTYSPPRVIVENNPNDAIPASLFDPSYTAIVLKTLFCFNEKDVNGLLFLVTSQESIGWLKQALCAFMEQYE